ncbi:hypothetical protein [Pedobacter zeae]|uniref:LTXXQ motif family protein n=2 Tax=Pedobacter zeae TaxID=1737356 RepID=A0A7W6KBI0_9SPHI|nr:hypothetical protein [Pedobacter zeae]MBB4108753.1 hypothetical protein [Pedobacter zeae]
MKKLLFLLLPVCFISLSAIASRPQSFSKTFSSKSSVIDSTKKMSAKEWKEIEKQLKNTMPKQMAATMLKQLKEAEKLGKSTSVDNQKALGNIMKDLTDNSDRMNYEIEKKEIIDDFKQEEFDSRTEKREARKEMRQELRDLKKEYKKDQKEKKKDKKAENLQFI